MGEYPRLLYRGAAYPLGETCRVEDAASCEDKLTQGWRLWPRPQAAVPAELPVVPASVDGDGIGPVESGHLLSPDEPDVVAPPVEDVPRKRGRPRKSE